MAKVKEYQLDKDFTDKVNDIKIGDEAVYNSNLSTYNITDKLKVFTIKFNETNTTESTKLTTSTYGTGPLYDVKGEVLKVGSIKPNILYNVFYSPSEYLYKIDLDVATAGEIQLTSTYNKLTNEYTVNINGESSTTKLLDTAPDSSYKIYNSANIVATGANGYCTYTDIETMIGKNGGTIHTAGDMRTKFRGATLSGIDTGGVWSFSSQSQLGLITVRYVGIRSNGENNITDYIMTVNNKNLEIEFKVFKEAVKDGKRFIFNKTPKVGSSLKERFNLPVGTYRVKFNGIVHTSVKGPNGAALPYTYNTVAQASASTGDTNTDGAIVQTRRTAPVVVDTTEDQTDYMELCRSQNNETPLMFDGLWDLRFGQINYKHESECTSGSTDYRFIMTKSVGKVTGQVPSGGEPGSGIKDWELWIYADNTTPAPASIEILDGFVDIKCYDYDGYIIPWKD